MVLKAVQFASGNGNTFIIYDFLSDYDLNFDIDSMREHLQRYPEIDCGLVITRLSDDQIQERSKRFLGDVKAGQDSSIRDLLVNCRDDELVIINMYVFEPGDDGFCGNGARCVCHYLMENYGSRPSGSLPNANEDINKKGPIFFIWSGDGYLHRLDSFTTPSGEPKYSVEMGISHFTSDKAKSLSLYNGPETLLIEDLKFHFVFTSEPHLILLLDESSNDYSIVLERMVAIAMALNLQAEKKEPAANCSIFPIGINCNLMQVLGSDVIRVTTFERVINRVTRACGTGSVSCVALARRMGLIQDSVSLVNVIVPGGVLNVRQEVDEFSTRVYLSGDTMLSDSPLSK